MCSPVVGFLVASTLAQNFQAKKEAKRARQDVADREARSRLRLKNLKIASKEAKVATDLAGSRPNKIGSSLKAATNPTTALNPIPAKTAKPKPLSLGKI